MIILKCSDISKQSTALHFRSIKSVQQFSSNQTLVYRLHNSHKELLINLVIQLGLAIDILSGYRAPYRSVKKMTKIEVHEAQSVLC